ncbi:hypothetical protein ACK3TF_005330 [Chlorella vulgaris]
MQSCALLSGAGRLAPLSRARRAQHHRVAASGPERQPGTSSSRLEHMDSVLLHPYHDLNMAENELLAYCSQLGPDEEPEKCWQAYSFLERHRDQAQAACETSEARDCAQIERLNDMARQLLSTGSVQDLAATFASLARLEELRSARSAQQEVAAATAAEVAEAAGLPVPDPVKELFARLDSDRDGKITVVEFRQGMDLLGDRLDGATVALISQAMEYNGREGIDEQQFADIVDAERLNSRSEVATMWRHHVPASRLGRLTGK